MKLKEFSTRLNHLPRPHKTNGEKHTIELRTANETEVRLAEPSTKKVGGAALVEYVDKTAIPPSKETQKDFGHLFPTTYIMEKYPEGQVTLEGAQRLIDQLDPENPYHDFAVGELALYQLAQGDVKYAYDSLELLGDSSLAVHVLSHIVMYEDDHKDNTLDFATISEELHEMAIEAYDQDNTTLTARALVEASEALEEDSELRVYAKVALLEHPEISQRPAHSGPVMDPDEHLLPTE
ncbi:MAG TPA: hypothetical protein VFH06_05475 [Candidatus Saccharimonadales bacterium]|nr:hypothetical protein [Candidatus Saccharimonadales bacterium]